MNDITEIREGEANEVDQSHPSPYPRGFIPRVDVSSEKARQRSLRHQVQREYSELVSGLTALQQRVGAEDDQNHDLILHPTGSMGGINYARAACSCGWSSNIRSEAAAIRAWQRHADSFDEDRWLQLSGNPRRSPRERLEDTRRTVRWRSRKSGSRFMSPDELRSHLESHHGVTYFGSSDASNNELWVTKRGVFLSVHYITDMHLGFHLNPDRARRWGAIAMDHEHEPDPRAPRGMGKIVIGSVSDQWVRCDKGHSHWGTRGAAGIMYRYRPGLTGEPAYCLQMRGPAVQYAGTWGLPGGAIESGETPLDTARREVVEEFGFLPAEPQDPPMVDDHGNWAYYTFLVDVDKPFVTESNDENSWTGWFTWEQMRKLPLHPTLRAWLFPDKAAHITEDRAGGESEDGSNPVDERDEGSSVKSDESHPSSEERHHGRMPQDIFAYPKTGKLGRNRVCVMCGAVFDESESGSFTGLCQTCRERQGMVRHEWWGEPLLEEGHYG